jgi:hypothetical protein
MSLRMRAQMACLGVLPRAMSLALKWAKAGQWRDPTKAGM